MENQIIDSILKKGDEMIGHLQEAYLFRSSLVYLTAHLISLFKEIEKLRSNTELSEKQQQAAKQLQQVLNHFDSFVPHLSESKWIQPALNWPVGYVHKLIDGFRKNVKSIIEPLGLDSNSLFVFDDTQDYINRRADYNHFKSTLSNMMSQINTNDAVGVQQQIESKFNEISKILAQNSSSNNNNSNNNNNSSNGNNSGSNNSNDNQQQQRKNQNSKKLACDFPMIQMKKRVEELLVQFQSINIENEDLMIQAPLGAGGFGSVCKAIRLSSSEIVAVKELRMDRLTRSSWASLYSELEAMVAVHHPFVLELVGAHITEPFRIITRFCAGKSLFDRLHRKNQGYEPLTETQLTTIAYQVALGMEYLHNMNIVHRDLKTLNILLDDNCDSFVADFGLSGMMKDNQDLCGGVGTPNYTAPEVLAHSRYGNKVDVYSYGVVLWEMITKKVPFSEMASMAIYEHVVTRNWRLPIPNDTLPALKKLITRCWSKNPSDRPAFSEIVVQFEKGLVYFPDSKKIDFLQIKKSKRCPPIALDYAVKVLKDISSPHFASVCYYLGSNCDSRTIEILRGEDVLSKLMEPSTIQHKGAVLVLASVLLKEDEIENFLEKGGQSIFDACITSDTPKSLISALKFAVIIPQNLLMKLNIDLAPIIKYVEDHLKEETTNYVVRFLSQFPIGALIEFKPQISKILLNVSETVADQDTFNAIVTLLPSCMDSIEQKQVSAFYSLLNHDFIVPSNFVSTLIQTNDVESYPSLFLNMMKATVKSDLTDVFIHFLQKCKHENPEVIDAIWRLPNFATLTDELLHSDSVRAAVFLLFCIAPNEEAALFLAESPILNTLISMNRLKVQRLQIFTVLCLHESFCEKTTYLDGINHLLVSSLSIRSLTIFAFNLIGALSKHTTTCQLLTDNGVLELFTQIFLSSNTGNNKVSHTILRNVANNINFVPQSSLIVSCLMQELKIERKERNEIMGTITAIVEVMPGSVQEHDIQRIVIPEMSKEDPQFVLLALNLLSVCDPSIFRNIYLPVFAIITKLLNNPKMLYPELIDAALDVMMVVVQQYDVTEFIKKTEFVRYLKEIIDLMDPTDSIVMSISGVLAILESAVLSSI